MKIFMIAAALSLALSSFAEARPYYGGGRHTASHGGHYSGARSGSSHRGGHYKNARTGNRYGRHR